MDPDAQRASVRTAIARSLAAHAPTSSPAGGSATASARASRSPAAHVVRPSRWVDRPRGPSCAVATIQRARLGCDRVAGRRKRTRVDRVELVESSCSARSHARQARCGLSLSRRATSRSNASDRLARCRVNCCCCCASACSATSRSSSAAGRCDCPSRLPSHRRFASLGPELHARETLPLRFMQSSIAHGMLRIRDRGRCSRPWSRLRCLALLRASARMIPRPLS